MDAVLGIDLGTQHLKIVVYDVVQRELLAVESAPLDLHQGDGGVAEQHTRWWLKALGQALFKVAPEHKARVAAIAVSGQQHGLVALDRADDTLVPVKLWCDTSTQQECEEITAAVGGSAACIELAGNPILPGYTASKVRWMRNNHPNRWQRLACILLPHDFLNLYLTGERCMEAGDASGTGFLDVRSRRWSPELLAAIAPDRDLRDCLPGLRTANQVIGQLRSTVAQEHGLPPAIPVAIGGGDNMMGAIGTGNIRPGEVTISLGTSGTVYAFADQPIVDPRGNIAAFCSSTGGWLPLLCTMNCTVSTELMRGLFGYDIEAFEAQVAQTARGAEGVLTLPFFNGERTPNLPKGKGCVVGLDGRNARAETLCRSAMEGATFALKFGLDALRDLGVCAQQVTLTGGGANSPSWRQVVADVLNLPVSMTQQTEGAAFGAALQALSVLDSDSSLETIAREHLTRDESRCCEPAAGGVHAYNEFYQNYQQAVAAMSDVYA